MRISHWEWPSKQELFLPKQYTFCVFQNTISGNLPSNENGYENSTLSDWKIRYVVSHIKKIRAGMREIWNYITNTFPLISITIFLKN